MLFRALALGWLVGVAAVLAGSCGGAKVPPSCNASSCSGCCTSDGSCVAAPLNADNLSCGKPGASCANCAAAGQTCVDFACMGTGGGSGGCGPSNCTGCCSGTSRDSVCIIATSDNNCGKGGEVCTSCDSGKQCKAGACTEPPVVGIACEVDGDCAKLGAGAQCRKKTSSGLDTYFEGYCTLDCSGGKESICPEGSVCVEASPEFGETDALCLDRCEGQYDRCRSPGYACYPLTSGIAQACWLDPLPQGAPADKVGEGCTFDEQCQNPPLDGFCVSGVTEDGGTSAFVQGYCTAPCFSDTHCSTDGGAVCVGVTTELGACFSSCPGPGSGQSSCRSGYVCQVIRDSMGTPIADHGVCGPDCRNAGDLCGMKTCNPNGYCQ